MRVETNNKLAQRNRQIAQYSFFFALAILIGGFILTNQQFASPQTTTENIALVALLSTLALPIGLIATLFSVRMTNLWIRLPRPENIIRDGLKGLSNNSVLYNYFHIPARHVLVCPQGVFVFTTRFQDGSFRVNGDRWETRGGVLSGLLRAFRRDNLGNPTRDAHQAAAHLQTIMDTIAPDVKVQPVVIFVDPRARLEIENPTVPVIYGGEAQSPNLKTFMRDMRAAKHKSLTVDQLRDFEAKTLPQ